LFLRKVSNRSINAVSQAKTGVQAAPLLPMSIGVNLTNRAGQRFPGTDRWASILPLRAMTLNGSAAFHGGELEVFCKSYSSA
jgi:hypothetical protein